MTFVAFSKAIPSQAAACARTLPSPALFRRWKSGPSRLPSASAMQRPQLEHIIRAAAGITGAPEFVIIGSQAVLGNFQNVIRFDRFGEVRTLCETSCRKN